MSRRPMTLRRRLAFQATLLYLAIGAAWIVATDVLLYRFVHDPVEVGRLETAKGWLFVGASALLVFLLTLSAVNRLHRAEATTSALVQSIADGVLIVGSDTHVSDANPAAARILGEPDRSRLVGMGPEEFARRYRVSLPDGTLVRPEQYASQRALRGEGVQSYKALIRPGSPQERVILATSAPVRTLSSGDVECVVSVMHDITDRERLDRLRDEFFAAAAHALKTPLAIVKAHASILARRSPVPADRSAAKVIDRQCGAMDRLVQNLLALSRIRSGSLRLHPRVVQLAELAQSVSRQMGSAWAERAIGAEVRAHPAVFADPERLAQVLRNLLEEAHRAAPHATPLTLLVEQDGVRARAGVRRRTSQEAPVTAPGGLDLEAHVNESLVSASGGRTLPEVEHDGLATSWVELPVAEQEIHAPG